MQRMLAERNGKGGRQSRYCLAVELAQKQSIWHYQSLKSCTFLRIVVATPNLVTQARSEQLAPFTGYLSEPGSYYVPDIPLCSIHLVAATRSRLYLAS